MRSVVDHIRRAFPAAAAAVFAAVVAGCALIALFTAQKNVAAAVAAGLLMVLCLSVSGNPRLFFLWGMVLAAPINLTKNFKVIPHMGGAAAFSIELVDFFIVPLLFFIFRDMLRGRRTGLRLSGVTFLYGAMITVGVITVFTGPVKALAVQEALQMCKNLLLFLVIINEVVRVRQFRHVVSALMLGLFAQVFIGLVQYVTNKNLHLQFLGEASAETMKLTSIGTYGGEPVNRVGALLGHSNFLSAFIALLLPVCIALLFTRMDRRLKAAAGALTVLSLVVLIATLSRMGWIDFALAFTILMTLSFVHPEMRTRFLTARVALIASVLLMALVFSGPVVKRLTRSDSGAVNFRKEFNVVAWRMVKDSPVIGHGLNSFFITMPEFTRYGGPVKLTEKFGEMWPVVHNIYLLYWSETGTLGFMFFVWLNLHLLYVGVRNTRHFDDDFIHAVNIGCISGLAAVMMDGMGSFFLRGASCARMFWIVAGLVIAIDYWHRYNRHASAYRADAFAGQALAGPGLAGGRP